MSIDERSRRIVQPHLLPGETLAWAGPAAVPPRPARLALLVGAATFLVIVVLGTMADASFFWRFVAAGIWLGAPMGLAVFNWPAQVDRSHNKPTHYAITDRRILTPSPTAASCSSRRRRWRPSPWRHTARRTSSASAARIAPTARATSSSARPTGPGAGRWAAMGSPSRSKCRCRRLPCAASRKAGPSRR